MTAMEIEPFLSYYEGILRPLFHNFKDIKSIGQNQINNWKEYITVNQIVAKKIIEVHN
jgi:trehalose-6-phosphate synthase